VRTAAPVSLHSAPAYPDVDGGRRRQSGIARRLNASIRRLADAVDAVEHGSNEYGTFYRVEGILGGPSGNLPVLDIWIKQAVDG
jgi:hypothetical protein